MADWSSLRNVRGGAKLSTGDHWGVQFNQSRHRDFYPAQWWWAQWWQWLGSGPGLICQLAVTWNGNKSTRKRKPSRFTCFNDFHWKSSLRWESIRKFIEFKQKHRVKYKQRVKSTPSEAENDIIFRSIVSTGQQSEQNKRLQKQIFDFKWITIWSSCDKWLRDRQEFSQPDKPDQQLHFVPDLVKEIFGIEKSAQKEGSVRNLEQFQVCI